MGKYILDRICDRRIDIDTGGHWENLMTYLKSEYPKFWLLSEEKKDDFILENFVFGEEDWSEKRSSEWLNREYVSTFSTGTNGYRLSEEIRSRKDLEEVAAYWRLFQDKVTKFSTWLVSELSRLETAMRTKGHESFFIKEDELDYFSVAGSFELLGAEFHATFCRNSPTGPYPVARYVRKEVNSAMVQTEDLSTFLHWFTPAIMNEARFGDEFKSALSKWIDYEIEFLEEDL